MMPSTSQSLRRNDAAAVLITALAAGAGPPAKRIATRRREVFFFSGVESGLAMIGLVDKQWTAQQTRIVGHAVAAGQGKQQPQKPQINYSRHLSLRGVLRRRRRRYSFDPEPEATAATIRTA